MKVKLPYYTSKDYLVLMMVLVPVTLIINSVIFGTKYFSGAGYFIFTTIVSAIAFVLYFILCGSIAVQMKKRFPEESRAGIRLGFIISGLLITTGLFLLLLFFIITWNFSRRETEIEISVPAADEGKADQRHDVGEIVVNVRKGGEVVVEGETLSADQLLQKLQLIAAVHKDQAVILRGDEKSEYQKVMNVLNTCQKAGIWNVSFATRPPETEGAPAPPN